MPLPGGLSTFTLTFGPYLDLEGNVTFEGVEGKLSVSPSIVDANSGALIFQSVNFYINNDGTATVGPLVHNDDPRINQGTQYSIEWQIRSSLSSPGGKSFVVPMASGSTVDYDLLTSTTGTATGPYALPLVTSVNGHAGAVTLTASDVGADAAGAAAAAQVAAVATAATDATSKANAAQAAAIAASAGQVTDASVATQVTSGATTTAALRAALGLPVASTVTTAGTLVAQKHNPADATTGPLTMTLPTGASAGTMLAVEKTDSTVNAVTVSGNMRGTAGQSIPLATAHEVRVFVADAAGSWWPIADHRTASSLDNSYGRVFTPQTYGAKADGTTDDTAAIQAAITAAYNNHGGTVYFPTGTYLVLGQLTVPWIADPNPGTVVIPQSYSMTWRGAGAATWDGFSEGFQRSGAVLDLRATTGPAKIDLRGSARLEITGLTFTDLGVTPATTVPIIQTTNTTLHVHDCIFEGNPAQQDQACKQDAIVLGGTSSTFDSSSNAAFGGYGTVIERNQFDRIRRCIWGRSSCNAVIISDNTFGKHCGGTTAESALTLDGTGQWGAYGNVIRGNLFEMQQYPYVVRLINAADNLFIGNGFYDATVVLLFAYRIEGYGDVTSTGAAGNGPLAISQRNVFLDAIFPFGGHYTQYIDTSTVVGTAVTPLYLAGGVGGFRNLPFADDHTIFQPRAAQAADTSTIWEIKRSTAEATNQNQQLMVMQNSGAVKLLGFGASLACGTTGTSIGNDGSVVKQGTGSLNLYAGTNGSDVIRINRGTLRLSSSATAARPVASSVGVGAVFFDTTLNKPTYSDGTNWRDATGTIV